MAVKKALLVLVVVALVAGVYVALRPAESVRLVPAWELLDPVRYRAMSQLDPFVSWAPDSRSLLFSAHEFSSNVDKVYRWKVGAKEIETVTEGVAPNITGPDEFVYLKMKPKMLMRRSIATGAESEFIPQIKNEDLWPEVTAFTYQPESKTVVLRLCEETRYYTPGSEEYTLGGKFVREVPTRMSEDIMDSTCSPDGSKSALLIQTESNKLLSLQIAKGKANRGRQVVRGLLGAVAWSPDGKKIAYSDESRVYLTDPESLKTDLVANVNRAVEPQDGRWVSRLSWSPNNRYLAALVYVPFSAGGDFPLIYVLDLKKSGS